MLRAADRCDAISITGMARRFHRATGSSLPFDAAHMHRTVLAHIDDPDACALMIEGGVIMGRVTTHALYPIMVASETLWWADADARGRGFILLDAFEEWAIASGASLIGMAARDDRLGAIMARRGYARAETHFIRMV